jgi:hypothetical protein
MGQEPTTTQASLFRPEQFDSFLGRSVMVCVRGNDQPISGTLIEGGSVLYIDSAEWRWRVPVESITAWANYSTRNGYKPRSG